jgi:hypothetical protein
MALTLHEPFVAGGDDDVARSEQAFQAVQFAALGRGRGAVADRRRMLPGWLSKTDTWAPGQTGEQGCTCCTTVAVVRSLSRRLLQSAMAFGIHGRLMHV